MTSQTMGAVPGSSPSWPDRASGGAVDRSCATRLSLARGATDAAPCKASVGVGRGGPRAGHSSRARGAVALAVPEAPRDFSPPPLRRSAVQTTEEEW